MKSLLRSLNEIPCPQCGGRDDHWDVRNRDEKGVLEADIVCDDCGTVVNRYYMGYTERPTTYTERWGRFFKRLFRRA